MMHLGDNKYCRYCNAGRIFKRHIKKGGITAFRCSVCPAGEWDDRKNLTAWQPYKNKEAYTDHNFKNFPDKQVSGQKDTGEGRLQEMVGKGVKRGKDVPDPVQRVSQPHPPGLGDPEDWP